MNIQETSDMRLRMRTDQLQKNKLKKKKVSKLNEFGASINNGGETGGGGKGNS